MNLGTFQRQIAGFHNLSSNLNSPMRGRFCNLIQHIWKSGTKKTEGESSLGLVWQEISKPGFM